MTTLVEYLLALPGGSALSRDYCNQPVSIDQYLNDDTVAVVLLCGRGKYHTGKCDPHGIDGSPGDPSLGLGASHQDASGRVTLPTEGTPEDAEAPPRSTHIDGSGNG